MYTAKYFVLNPQTGIFTIDHTQLLRFNHHPFLSPQLLPHREHSPTQLINFKYTEFFF